MIRKPKNQSFLWWFICLLFFIVIDRNIQAETLKLTLRNSNDSIHEWKDVEWNTDEVAVIICDMWTLITLSLQYVELMSLLLV